MSEKDYLEILELDKRMSRAEILSKGPVNYKKLSKIYHPDNSDTGSSEAFISLKEAFDVIMNVDKYYELVGKVGRTTDPTKLINEVWNSI